MASNATETAAFGSLAWFSAWGQQLANAGLTRVTNTILGNTTAEKTATATTTSSGSVLTKAMTWLPYIVLAGAGLVLLLVLRRRR
jgi:hypothetical protein